MKKQRTPIATKKWRRPNNTCSSQKNKEKKAMFSRKNEEKTIGEELVTSWSKQSTDGLANEGDCNGSMPNAWCMIQSCAVLDETLPKLSLIFLITVGSGFFKLYHRDG